MYDLFLFVPCICIIYIILILNSIFCSDLFYVRNHLPVPEVNIVDYTLELAVEGTTKKTLNFETLKKKYKKHTITAAVMCGGNRRSDMAKVSIRTAF